MPEQQTPESKKETTKEEVAVVVLILAVLCFFFLSKILALYIFGIFLMLLPLKKWYISVIIGLVMWWVAYGLWSYYKVPEIQITSQLENNTNKEYILQWTAENFSEIFVNDEKIEISDKNFEKNIILENLETSVKILAKNGFLQEKEVEITIKRNETEEEVQKRIETEKQKEQEMQEKAEQEKKDKIKQIFLDNELTYSRKCKESIKTLLKSPKTADFDNLKYLYSGIKWQEGIIKWQVSAQNGFGAMITSNYECVFTWSEEDEKYSYKYQIVQ